MNTPADQTARRPPSATFFAATLRIFDLSIGEMLWSRRTIFMALVVGAPIAIAVVSRIVDANGVAPLRVNGARVNGAGMFGMLIWLLYVRFIVPVLGAFYGTALMADEVEDKTITYLFTRPISRSAVLVGKYVAYLVCTSLVVLPSVTLVYFLLVPFRDVPGSFMAFLTDLGILGLGLAAYGALFAFAGTSMRRPLIVGLVFVFGWEQIALLVPGYLKRLTVAHYLQGLVPHAMPTTPQTSMLLAVFRDVPSAGASVFWLSCISIAGILLAARIVERREFVLDQ